MSESCEQHRNELLQISKFWLQKVKTFAHANQTKKTNITTTPLETENLSKNINWKSEITDEKFPDKCRNVAAGMEVRVFFSRGDVFEITHQILTHDVAVKSSPSFFIQIKSLSPTKIISGKLSRFWSDFMLYECPEQVCWRDLFDFSYLLADSVVILIVFIFVIIVSALIFTEVGFYRVF
ncbi:unnamed protein product [Allacma fusca]|uniref:Uncharacterized protein n=1 Tax=Allacma fusca TaxID=39272 RepID=A0A8J2Q4Y5_9HEXA|nr:unnamed protein product [Allacma fusca]